jgi:hypothetical protein
MKNWFNRNYKTLIISAFLIPIITVAIVSISHVTKWYGISNPLTWAVYLSIGVEIAALSALAAISANMGKKVYFPFGIVTLVQFIGNIYFAYSYIDINSPSFTSWVELVSPLIEFIGVEPTDLVGHKRFLAFFSGGMLPLISLSFLHMLVKFTQENKEISSNEPIKENIVQSNDNVVEEPIKEEIPTVDAKDIVGEVSRIRLSEEDLMALEKLLNKTPQSTPEETPKVKEEFNISTKDVPEEFMKIINENFWDLTDNNNTPQITNETLDSIKEQYEEREDYGYSTDDVKTEEQPVIETPQVDVVPEEVALDGYDGFITEENIVEITETPIVVEEVIETPTPVIEEEIMETPTLIVNEEIVETPTPVIEEEINEPEKPYGFEYTEELDNALNQIQTPEPTPTPIVEEIEEPVDEVIEEPVEIEPTPIIEEPTSEIIETPLPTDESEEEKKK